MLIFIFYKVFFLKLKNEYLIPFLLNLSIPFLALISALLVSSIFLAIAGVNPFNACISIFTSSLGTSYGLTETIVKMIPLLFVSTGISIAYRTGITNIGGEGQIIMGALMGTVVALFFSHLPSYILLPLIFTAGFIGGGFYGLIPATLKAYLNVNEILTTVMLNSIALQILYLLLRGVLMDPQEIAYGTGYPQSAPITKSAWLFKLIGGTRLHTGIFIALLFSVTAWILLWKTTIGYRMRAVGKNTVASECSGINVKKYLILAMFLSGGLAGLAGMVEVSGIHHRLLDGISGGYGFSGIVTALFGKLHPLACIPASFLFGALLVGSDMLQRTSGIPGSMVYVIQGLVVIFIVSSEIFSKKILLKKFVQERQ
jgi:simple sugar transport system permease protein